MVLLHDDVGLYVLFSWQRRGVMTDIVGKTVGQSCFQCC
jgi:hypothetical protein